MALVLSANTGAQAATAPTFPDVPEKNWCYAYVTDLAAKGIVAGLPDGSYGPEQDVTRGSVAKLLWEALNYKGHTLEAGNTTLVSNVWSATSVNALANANILVAAEYPNGFVEGEAMSRLETIKAIVRAYLVATPSAKLPTSPTLTFADAADIPDADKPLVALGVELDIINGVTTDAGVNFFPATAIQRSTAATMVSRFLEVVGEQSERGSAQTDVPDYVAIEAPVIKTTTGETIEWVVPPTIDANYSYPFQDGYSLVVFGDETTTTGYGFVNTEGKMMGLYPDVEQFSDGFEYGRAVVYTTQTGPNGKRMGGVIDTDFNWIFGPVECMFVSSSEFFITVTQSLGGDTTDEQSTTYDLNGKEVTEEEVLAVVEPTWADFLAIKATIQKKIKGVKTINKGDWSGLYQFTTSDPALLAEVNKDPIAGLSLQSLSGFADENGKLIVPAKYTNANPYENGYGTGSVRITMDTWQTDIYDASGKRVYTYYRSSSQKEIDMYNQNQFHDYGEGLVTTVRTSGKWGYMKPNGDMVIDRVFDRAASFVDGLATVVYNGKLGIIKNPIK